MNYEDAHRNVTNLAAQFASITDMLPTLEKARDAETFLHDSHDKIQTLKKTIADLDATAVKKNDEAEQAKQVLSSIQKDINKAIQDRSSLRDAYFKDSAQYTVDFDFMKKPLEAEIQNLVAQRDSLKAEIVSVSEAIRRARVVEQSLKDNIKKANAALAT